MNYVIKAKTPKSEVRHTFKTPEDIEWVSIAKGDKEIKWFVDGRVEIEGKTVDWDEWIRVQEEYNKGTS